MAINEEQILVRIINKVEGSEELVKEKNLVRELKKDNGDLTRVYEEQTNSQRKRVTINEKTNSQGMKEVNVNKEVLSQGPKFQMHYLGIMFGGMALNRAMSNLTATSKEWVGIGELMSTTMGVVMLPATMELLDKAVLPLMDALLGMPESVQTVVGVSVLGLEALGGIAMTAGQIMLGAAAFSYQFPQMAAAIKSGLTSNLSKGIGKGVGVIVGLTIAWGSVSYIRDGIDEGNMQKELLGVLGVASGMGLAGLSIAGPIGGLIGFTLGVGIGLIIDWTISENKWKDKAKDMGISDEIIGEHIFRNTLLGGLLGSGKSPSSDYISAISSVDSALGDSGFTSFAVGGNVTHNGLHFLHEGETVLRKDQSSGQNGNISIVNNINVSDSREMERMINASNEKMIREVRRNATA